MRRERRRYRPVRNLKMQGEQGLPRGGPFGLEYLFILISAVLAALSRGADMSWSRSRHLALYTLRRTWIPMLRPGRKGTVLLLLGALVLQLTVVNRLPLPGGVSPDLVLLVVVALGLVIFGVYSGCEARWREVRPG